MYCYSCGKEISDDAIMCPQCGASARGKKIEIQTEKAEPCAGPSQANLKGLAVVAIMLTSISFITGILFGVMFLVTEYAVVLLYVLSATTILPALTALCISVYAMIGKKGSADKAILPLSIVSVVLCGAVLVFLLVVGIAMFI